MSGEVTLRATLARPFLAATTTPQVIYALIEVQPSQVVAQVRMPVNVCFVLDRSGSMRGEKMERVRQATSMAIDRLNAQDFVAVVIFDHRTEVIVPFGPVHDPTAIKRRIGRIRDAGGTRIAPAVDLGLREIAKDQSGAIRRMVLLTDGQTEHEKECILRADDAGRLGVPITALGVGRDWNEDLLIEMANRSGGTADFISRPDAIESYFQNTVQQAQNTAIHNATLNLRLVQGVSPRAVWQVIPLINNLGYRPISDRDVSVPLGEVETGQGRTVLFELLVDPRAAGTYRVGQVEAVYDVPALGLRQEKTRQDLLLTFTADPAQLSQVNPNVMNIVEKVSAFKLQTRALQDAAEGNVHGATQKLQSAVTRLLSQGELELAETMQQEIANLEQSGQLSSEGQKTIKFQGRKTVRLSDIDLPKE
ncbi:vWA domain-containing protein [Candidatus Viridilinea mediisalina]|uniref:VWA domain-containing protein n=1 Tax=Candidatus Viridilinea mediisalina TaxID=2024553 RepID=A0A2A6RJI9_9CHLR|nr:VWA domain-containing protein [Candidatus Viridilinea mediisalina]PDW03172.1 VWA domain-containing protein [Candidatus Viridilinea mediisalina]